MGVCTPEVELVNTGSNICDLLILNILYDGSMGRYTISERTGLSESRVRSILEGLRTKKLVYTEGKSSGRKGTSLTDKGRSKVKRMRKKVSFLFSLADDELKERIGDFDSFCIAHLHDVSELSKSTLEMRDEMVRNGAKGAVIVVWDNVSDSFVFPEDKILFDLPERIKDDVRAEGTLIVGFGNDEGLVNYATFSLAAQLL